MGERQKGNRRDRKLERETLSNIKLHDAWICFCVGRKIKIKKSSERQAFYIEQTTDETKWNQTAKGAKLSVTKESLLVESGTSEQ